MSASEETGNRGTSAAMVRSTRCGPHEPAEQRRPDGTDDHELGRLAEVALPADDTAPGAARMVIDHCLTGLVAHGIVGDAQLLGSELVSNSLVHARLGHGDIVRVRVYIGAAALRVEVENPGIAGVIARRSDDTRSVGGFGLQLVELLAARWGVARSASTSVWFELARA